MVDLRTLTFWDTAAVLEAVRRTGRILVDLGWADALAERRQAIRAVVDRRMVKFAAVRSSTSSPTLTSRRSTASAEARRSLPPGARDPARAVRSLPWGAVARQPAVPNGGLTVRLHYGVGLTVDHRVAEGADAARALANPTAPTTRPETLLQAAAHPTDGPS